MRWPKGLPRAGQRAAIGVQPSVAAYGEELRKFIYLQSALKIIAFLPGAQFTYGGNDHFECDTCMQLTHTSNKLSLSYCIRKHKMRDASTNSSCN